MRKAIEVKEVRSFGLLVGGIFAVIGLLPTLLHGGDPTLWALVAAMLLIILALVLPRSLGLVYRIWITIGNALGWINTKIILSVVFYGMFTPMGLVKRLLGKDSMARTFSAEDTYRVVRLPRPPSHMKRQF